MAPLDHSKGQSNVCNALEASSRRHAAIVRLAIEGLAVNWPGFRRILSDPDRWTLDELGTVCLVETAKGTAQENDAWYSALSE